MLRQRYSSWLFCQQRISYWQAAAEGEITTGQNNSLNSSTGGAGDFVITWDDDQDDNDYYQIFARGFKSNSSQNIPDFTVNTVGDGQQRATAIAMAANGDFVITWEDDQDDNGFYQILARGFYSDGSERFPQFTVNSIGSGQQYSSAIAMAANGDVVITWQDDYDENGKYQILARGFYSDGSQHFADFTVNSEGTGQQGFSTVAMAGNGDFVVTWQDDLDDNGFWQIFARRFYSNSSQRFADFTVNSEGAGQQRRPAVAMVRKNTAYLPLVQ